MPFRSEKQRAYLYANEPQMAKKWASEHGNKIVKKGFMVNCLSFKNLADAKAFAINELEGDRHG